MSPSLQPPLPLRMHHFKSKIPPDEVVLSPHWFQPQIPRCSAGMTSATSVVRTRDRLIICVATEIVRFTYVIDLHEYKSYNAHSIESINRSNKTGKH